VETETVELSKAKERTNMNSHRLLSTIIAGAALALPSVALAGDHFYTGSVSEYNGMQPGWVPEGNFRTVDSDGVTRPKEGWVFKSPVSDPIASTVPLIRLYNPTSNDHFYTINQAESNNAQRHGYRFESADMHVFPANTTPAFCTNFSDFCTKLYRTFNPTSGDHIYTTSLAEKNNSLNVGYQDEGVAAIVLKKTSAFITGNNTKPLYRGYNGSCPQCSSGINWQTVWDVALGAGVVACLAFGTVTTDEAGNIVCIP
jgi:hypothetical protein